jgi:hypothetical protein
VFVGVAVLVGVLVAVAVFVGVAVLVGVLVAVAVAVGVAVLVGVLVAVAVFVGVYVSVAVLGGVFVGVGVQSLGFFDVPLSFGPPADGGRFTHLSDTLAFTPMAIPAACTCIAAPRAKANISKTAVHVRDNLGIDILYIIVIS